MRGFIRWAHTTIGVIERRSWPAAAPIALLLFGDELEPVKRTCMWLGICCSFRLHR